MHIDKLGDIVNEYNKYIHMLLMITMVKKLLKHFMKRNYKKQTNKNLG